MPYVEWTPAMGEISGFGGAYEAACRAMVKAGVEYWEAQQAAAERGARAAFDPSFRGFKDVFGITIPGNRDGVELERAILRTSLLGTDGMPTTAGGSGVSGAMMQAAIEHTIYFMRNGAEAYVRELTAREAAERESAAAREKALAARAAREARP
jgi:hypothetical protein